jgi:hypothetical protein
MLPSAVERKIPIRLNRGYVQQRANQRQCQEPSPEHSDTVRGTALAFSNINHSCDRRACHQAALFHALLTGFGAAPAVFLFVFFAFRGAGLAGVGAAAA